MTSNDNWVTLTETFQRNATAFAKLFNFNFLNYFYLNAYWIYVLGTTALPLIERLLKCGNRIEKKLHTKQQKKMEIGDENNTTLSATTEKVFRHIVSHFFTTSLCNALKRFSSALFTECLRTRVRSRFCTHTLSLFRIHQWQPTNSKQSLFFCFSFHFILFVITATLTSYQITSGIVNHFFRPIKFFDIIDGFV